MLVVVVRNKAELIELAVNRLVKLIVAVLEEGLSTQAAVNELIVTLQPAVFYIYISVGRDNNK